MATKILKLQLYVAAAILLAISSSSIRAEDEVHEEVTLSSGNNDPQQQQQKAPHQVTVVAPKYLRPQSDYHVLVNLANSEQPASIDLQLTGGRDSNREQTEAKSVLAKSGDTQTVKFSIGDWPSAEYILSVQAQAIDRSWNFSQETTLSFHAKTFSTFIQTDKAIYKPGQLVQFRILTLTQELTPLPLKEELKVIVSDAKRNVIKQWNGLSTWRGLVSLELQLSEEPVLGDWTIKVEARGQESEKRFQVAEYILPTFGVSIKLPSYATYNESDVVATVKATYTYGKPVNGHVTLTVQPLVRFVQLGTRPLEQTQFRARLENGSADISVDLAKVNKAPQMDFFEREIEFFALVEEDLTGRKYNSTEVIKIYEKNHKIDFVDSAGEQSFKPGLGYLAQLKVAYQDDTPVENNGPEVEVRFSAHDQHLETVKLRPVNGIIEHSVQVPRKVARSSLADEKFAPSYLEITATYRGQTHRLSFVYACVSESQEYMQVSLPQLRGAGSSRKLARRSVNVNDELRVQVQATEGMQQVTCQGLARGDIVWALSPDAHNKTEFEFEVKVDQRMAPEVRILCFYVRPANKEILADSVRVSVGGLMKNLAKISTSREEAKPRQEVEVSVFTKPNSLVGLMGVDQSVLLLKSGNDITQKDVSNEVMQYGSSAHDNEWAPRNTDGVFSKSEVVVLTNNLVHNGYGYRFGKLLYSGAYALRPMMAVAASSPAIALDSLVLGSVQQAPPDIHLGKKRSVEPLIIRNFFPETWLWSNATAGQDGSASFKAKVPDTITSWELSAFSLSESAGLGLSQGKTSVRVFRPFFVKLNLPYSIIRGETVSIQAVVFNYQRKPTSAEVTLDNSNGDFEFVEAANSIEDEKRSAGESQSRLVRIPAEDGVSVSFLITPRKLGHIDIKVTARGEQAGDGLVRKLLVKPEGQTQFMNKAMLISLDQDRTKVGRNVSIEVPANAVPGSQKVFVSAIGDLMGAGLSNVDDLLRLPYGCGEQNMINLVPNIVILNYLQKTNRLRDSQRIRAIKNIETGYQRQLNYMRKDGSFSAFGDSDANGSVWLTAYVLKSFQQARGLVTLDERVIRRAGNFLGSFARQDGSFEEVGMVHHKALQSSQASEQTGSESSSPSTSIYLSAYTTIALLQRPIKPDGDAPASVPLDEVLERGIGFLERQLDGAIDRSQSSPYDLAIIAYALNLARRQPAMDRAYEKLWSVANEKEDSVWWEVKKSPKNEAEHGESGKLLGGSPEDALEFETISRKPNTTTSTSPPLKPLPVTTKQSAHLFVPDSLSIEMTALALLTTVRQGELERALPIVRWLISQQNSNGGFASTQDTVLAIEALAAFAEANAVAKKPLSMDVDVISPPSASTGSRRLIQRNNVDQFSLSSSNALVYQQLRLDDNSKWVQVNATGSGSAVVQVSWQYNLLVSAEKPAFYLSPNLDRTSNINYLQLSVCTYYKAGEASNMAVMEIELPSGYVADVESLPGLTRHKNVKRTETSHGDTKVMIYLDKVTHDNEICVTVPAHRTTKVSNNKPVPVSIYDYYNRQQAARIFYEPLPASSCDICEADTCSESCSTKPKKVERLVSLHEQRKLARNNNATSNGSTNTHENLKTNSTNGASANTTLDASKLLPLAPVLKGIVSAAKKLYGTE